MRKIVILGTAPSSIALAPYDDPSWAIWACSPGTYGVAKRIDEFFELHRYLPGASNFQESYCKFLKEFKGPLWMSKPVAAIPHARIIDIDGLVEKYSPFFFTSTIAWMMAMAIEQKPDVIALYGVDMAATEEWGYQRAGCQYFALIAKTLGIEVITPPESDLLRPAPLYGVCQNSQQWIKHCVREQEITHRINDCNNRLNAANQELLFLKGAQDDLNWSRQTFAGGIDTIYLDNTTVQPVPALMGLTNEPIKKPTENRTKKPIKKKRPIKKKGKVKLDANPG